MSLKSGNLEYVRIGESQYMDFRKWYSNETVMRTISGEALTDAQLEKRFRSVLLENSTDSIFGMYAVYVKTDSSFLGMARFTLYEKGILEVGYGCMPEYWGRGYASEILDALIARARTEKDVDHLIGIVRSDNHISRKMLVKRGFVVHSSENSIDHFKMDLSEAQIQS